MRKSEPNSPIAAAKRQKGLPGRHEGLSSDPEAGEQLHNGRLYSDTFRDDEGPLQPEPIILSAAHGLQLVGVQLCSAPARAKRFLFTLPAGNISDGLLRLLSSQVYGRFCVQILWPAGCTGKQKIAPSCGLTLRRKPFNQRACRSESPIIAVID
ncbi:hypothetical protein EYF80_007248 [Liparis tanakae]|uniref:Uncharacterized protein n=1 Tax=Liparis tanakae TaxID=230148 RepID=A0A4Z2IYZ7_9TELE|nr:hypothetical protein EYF80_007248 [Liparis tanakae]